MELASLLDVLGPIFALILGGSMVLFSRRFSLGVLQYQEEVWKTKVTETRIRRIQVFTLVVGTSIVIIGLVGIAQRLL